MTDLSIVTADGGKRTIPGSAVAELAARVSGGVLREGDDGYDDRRRIWNGRVDRKPALIARCAKTEDVVLAVRFAREHGARVSVRSGGHNIWGTSICDGGVVVDLSRLNAVEVDPAKRRLVVGPGARWQDVDRATQAHGLAAPGGQHSEVGVGGYMLGGGIGWLVRKHGLAVDHLRSAEVVLADGSVVTADASRHPELFWALRGGGGNFGVVTSFELELQSVGPNVVAGMVIHPLERAGEVLRFFRAFTERGPEDLHAVAVLMTAPTGQRGIALAVCREGTGPEGEAALAELRAFGPPVMDQIQPMPYVALQSMMDGLAPAGRSYINRSRFLRGVDDAALDAIVAHFGAAPSPTCTTFLHPLGGALARVPADATAFAHRQAAFCYVAEASWAEPSAAEAHTQWVGSSDAAVASFATGTYLNDIGRGEDVGEDVLRSAFGDNHARLARVKATYDPTNFFRHNQNVAPSN